MLTASLDRLRVVRWPLVALVSLLLGLGLGALGAAAGPWVLLGLPVLLVGTAVVLRRPALAPCVAVLAMPFGLINLPGGVDAIQAVVLLVVGLVVVARLTQRRPPVAWATPLGWGLALAVWAVLSTFRAPSIGFALKQDVAIALALLLVSSVLASCTTWQDVRRLATTVSLLGAVVCATSLRAASHLQAVRGGQQVDNRLQGTFTEPNQFGTFSAVVLMVSVGLLLGARSRGERLRSAACALLALAALGLALSRGAWIGTVLATGLLLFLLPNARRLLVLVAVPLLLLGVALGALQPDRPEVQVLRDRFSTFGDVNGNPYDNRPSIWREGRREVVDSPLLGQGPGQFPVVSTRSASASQQVAAQHAHDVLLTTSAELGLPAAAMLVAFTLRMLAVVRRTVRRLAGTGEASLVAGCAAALTVVVGQGVVDFELRNSVILALLSLVAGIVLSAARLAAVPRPREPVPEPVPLLTPAGRPRRKIATRPSGDGGGSGGLGPDGG